jgi:hypothetical protein
LVVQRFPTGMLDEDARDVAIVVVDVGQRPRFSTMKSNNLVGSQDFASAPLRRVRTNT